MVYTRQEEDELNKQLNKWQASQLKAVRKNNIDSVFESMTNIDSSVWEIVAKAQSYKDVNEIVWSMAEKVLLKYCKMAHN